MEKLIETRLPNWRLVAQEQQDTLEAVDNLWIVQNQQSMDCLLVFEGTHTAQEFSRNLRSDDIAVPYCGFPGVHHGYVEKLRSLMSYSMSKLRPKLWFKLVCRVLRCFTSLKRCPRTLSKCYRVACTGHSLGGSLCEIFAACANSGRRGDKDYEMQRWQVGAKELMPKMPQKPLSKDNL